MVCWETLGPGIHVDATCNPLEYCLRPSTNTVSDQVQPFKPMALPDVSGPPAG